jgi:hypothetical protein
LSQSYVIAARRVPKWSLWCSIHPSGFLKH